MTTNDINYDTKGIQEVYQKWSELFEAEMSVPKHFVLWKITKKP